MATPETPKDIVLLVPGFLGFTQLGSFSYFSDSFWAGLSAALRSRTGQNVPVIRIALPPTASLAERQIVLGHMLADQAQKHAGDTGGTSYTPRIHLVGHSTGGVDAQLLTHAEPLSPGGWPDRIAWLQDRLRSVISIASPHQGTCLANAPLAALVADPTMPMHLLESAREGLGFAVSFLKSGRAFVGDHDFFILIGGLLGTVEGHMFLSSVLACRNLIKELKPEYLVKLYSENKASAKPVHRRSFVTVAGMAAGPSESQKAMRIEMTQKQPHLPVHPPDSIFTMLSRLTAGADTTCATTDAITASLARLEETRTARLIAADPRMLPERFDARVNDGVVNSARQLIDPQDTNELASLVVADHLDVTGHYDKVRTAGVPLIQTGVLHSGSAFRDAQFIELMDAIAKAVAAAP